MWWAGEMMYEWVWGVDVEVGCGEVRVWWAGEMIHEWVWGVERVEN